MFKKFFKRNKKEEVKEEIPEVAISQEETNEGEEEIATEEVDNAKEETALDASLETEEKEEEEETISANDTNKAFYYIGSGTPRILKEYLFRIGELAGCADKVGVGIRPDDGIKYSMEMFDNSDLVATVGEYVSTDFDNGINKTIDWLKTL